MHGFEGLRPTVVCFFAPHRTGFPTQMTDVSRDGYAEADQ